MVNKMEIKIPNQIIKGIVSGKKNKIQKNQKAKIQRLSNNQIQISIFTDKQVFHKNYTDEAINQAIIELLESDFNNLELHTNDYLYNFRVTSKGKILSSKKKNTQVLVSLDHNKKKNYLLEEGMIIPALIDLGVMTPNGEIVKARYDKFKQINRFLEIIDDSIKDEKSLNIIDFGCGKSYLTFILYYYLVEVKKMECNIIGLDLKEDVIDYCNKLSLKYNYYDNLKFYKGDISNFKETAKIDMIVTLHACDTATDFALYHAIKMKCKYIFSVPCCQHEINANTDSTYLHAINKFGILKERFSAIVTDAIRANILQYCGYKTQVMEFVDFENSPKNLLIRAVLTDNKPNAKIKEEIDELLINLNTNQTLYDLIFKDYSNC